MRGEVIGGEIAAARLRGKAGCAAAGCASAGTLPASSCSAVPEKLTSTNDTLPFRVSFAAGFCVSVAVRLTTCAPMSELSCGDSRIDARGCAPSTAGSWR